MSVFKISLPLSDVIPNASLLSDLTKSRNICGDYISASGRHLVLCTYAQKIVDFSVDYTFLSFGIMDFIVEL